MPYSVSRRELVKIKTGCLKCPQSETLYLFEKINEPKVQFPSSILKPNRLLCLNVKTLHPNSAMCILLIMIMRTWMYCTDCLHEGQKVKRTSTCRLSLTLSLSAFIDAPGESCDGLLVIVLCFFCDLFWCVCLMDMF